MMVVLNVASFWDSSVGVSAFSSIKIPARCEGTYLPFIERGFHTDHLLAPRDFHRLSSPTLVFVTSLYQREVPDHDKHARASKDFECLHSKLCGQSVVSRILASLRVESPMSVHEEEGKRYDLAQSRSIGA